MLKELPPTAVRICNHCAETLKAHKLTAAEKNMVESGAFVKVNCCREGFWVKVIEVSGKTIRGIVDNDIVQCVHYTCGDTVQLELHEVYQVIPKEKP